MHWMNLQSSWISVVGLLVEVAGLGFLFYDLQSTKSSDRQSEAMEQFLREMQSKYRQQVVLLNRTFRDLTGMFAALMELELGDKLPADMRAGIVSHFQSAQSSLLSDEEYHKMEAAELVALGDLVMRMQRQVASAKRLLLAARWGIGLVVMGATAQLLDLILF